MSHLTFFLKIYCLVNNLKLEFENKYYLFLFISSTERKHFVRATKQGVRIRELASVLTTKDGLVKER